MNVQSQLPLVASLQNALASNSTLVLFWKAITLLGNEEFFLLLIPIVYWCVSSRRGLQLGALVIGGDAINVLCKLLFASPRPYWFGEPIRQLSTDPSFGLPSSHAQNALAVWLFLAYVASREYGRIRPYSVAVIFILLISLSRIVLGVHFPTDILAGWILGALWLGLFLKVWDRGAAWFRKQNVTTQIGLPLIAVVTTLFAIVASAATFENRVATPFYSASFEGFTAGVAASFARGGALFGLILGVALLLRGKRLDVSGARSQKIIRFLVGFVGLLIIWRGLALVFPRGENNLALFFRFVRYALLSLWVAWLAPIVFMKLGLGKAGVPATEVAAGEPSAGRPPART